jgi:hypothetical protein
LCELVSVFVASIGAVDRGVDMAQWQYEVTSGGRIWYVVDVEHRTLWLRHAGPGHPSETQ